MFCSCQVDICKSHQQYPFPYVAKKYPTKSARGNQYILIAFNYDANAILAESIKNRQARTITEAYEKLQQQFIIAGVAPHTWILGNEKSGELVGAFKNMMYNFKVYHLILTVQTSPNVPSKLSKNISRLV